MSAVHALVGGYRVRRRSPRHPGAQQSCGAGSSEPGRVHQCCGNCRRGGFRNDRARRRLLGGRRSGVRGSPAARSGLAVAGSLYFAWLGVQLFRSNQVTEDGSTPRSLSLASMFLLQFVNPKAWLLVLALTATAHGSVADLAILISIVSGISMVCLSLWAAAGRIIGIVFPGSGARRWVDWVLGISLIALAD